MGYTGDVSFDTLFDHGLDVTPEALEPGADAPSEALDFWKRVPASGGVYLLTDAEDRFVQLAATADLRRAVRVRLGDVTESGSQESAVTDTGETPVPHHTGETPVPHLSHRRPRADLRQVVRRVRWREAHSAFETTFVYWRVARLLMPRDYLDNVAFGPCWFVQIDPEAAVPRFTVTKSLPPREGTTLAPFATQGDASRFVQTLEDAFDLCRYIHILEQTPHGQACAYFEMGKCPAPCDGSIPMSAYRDMIRAALRFAVGERADVFAEWEKQMRAAADARAFERAALIKQRIERARAVEHDAYQHLRPIESFDYLVVQRGGGRTRVKPFFVRGGVMSPGEAVRIRKLGDAVPAWLDRMRSDAPDRSTVESRELAELTWLVSHFLFKHDAPGLFLHVSDLCDAEAVVDRIRERFARKTQEAPSSASGPAAP